MAHQTAHKTVSDIRRQPSSKMLVGVSLLLIFTVDGCSSARQSTREIFSRFRPSHQAAKSADADTSKLASKPKRSEKKKNSIEPAVAANVVLAAEDPDNSTTSPATKNDKRLKSSTEQVDARAVNESSTDQGPQSKSGTKLEASDTRIGATESIISSLEKLNPALVDDFQQDEKLIQGSLTELADRLRIDSLVSQAKNLLESGQLEQAQLKAQLAQDLSDQIQVDYSPEEDRPIDLVRRIQGQLESIHSENESSVDHNSSEISATPAQPENSQVVAKPMKPVPNVTANKDSSSLARLRRDWSTFFRPKKRQIQDPAVPVQISEATMQTKENSSSLSNPQIQRATKSNDLTAVVMANQSIALGDSAAMTTSSVSFISEGEEEPLLEKNSSLNGTQGLVNDGNLTLKNEQQSLLVDIGDSAAPLDIEEASDTEADFDTWERPTVASPVSTTSDSPRLLAAEKSGDRLPERDWTGLCLGCLITAFLVVGCVRRRNS